MSTFFQQTAQAMIAKHIDRFPLLKLDQVIDWQPIEQYLNRQRTRYLRDHRGRPAYPLLSMFKAVLPGQWHSLSDPELEHSLITRIDFNLFCRFDELSIPDYSTLCRYRNRLAQDDTLSELLKLINCQLAEKNLKVEKASAAVVDATIIQTAGSKQRQAIEVDEEGQVSGQTTPSKNKDARWTKKNGLRPLQKSLSPNSRNPNTGFRLFPPQSLPILPKCPLNPPRTPHNQASGPPFRRQQAHLAC